MFNDLKSLALNIFFILSVLFFYQVFILDNPKVKNKFPFLLYSGLTVLVVILCMSFPFSVGPGFIFDLRAIPFILGSLYGGYKLSVFLLATMSIYRFYIGGDGFYITLLVLSVSFLCFLYFFPRFHHFESRKKISSLVLLALLYSLVSCGGLLWFAQSLSAEFLGFSLMYTTIQLIGMWMTAYFIETIKKNLQLRDATYHIEKLKVVSELAASVSHEVRNPLTTVRGFIQMLLQDPDIPLEKRTRYLGISLQELIRAQSIISDYLNFAKPNIDYFEPVDLSQETKYILNIATSLINMNEIEVYSHIEEECWVLGDRQKLQQCLINIVKNGIEAMEDGGSLTIILSSQDEEFHLEIRDSGMGMTPAQVKRLGNPYYSTKEKGTGLGTMVAFSIVKSMGGRITVHSNPGEGTSLRMVFPKLEDKQLAFVEGGGKT